MIIPKEDLIVTTTPNGDKVVRHRVVRVQLFVPSLDTVDRNKIYFQQIDSMGNMKSSKKYEGFNGFWDATKEFEDFIAKELGIQEVLGFEVGMVFELDQDFGNFKAGQMLVVLEVGQDGTATSVRPIASTQMAQLSNSLTAIPLTASSELKILQDIGVTRINDIELDKNYAIKSDDDFILLPDKYDYKDYKVNLVYKNISDQPETEAVILNIGFKKQPDGLYKIAARVQENFTKDEYFTELINLNKV